jgi:hypothetical protein
VRRALLPLALLALLASPMVAPSSAAFDERAGHRGTPARGTGVDLTPVSNWSYTGGTDLEFATIKGRDYAVVPSESAHSGFGALRIFDLTKNPAVPPLVGYLECNVTQNDVQVRGTTVFMGVDGGVKGTQCFDDLGVGAALGVLAISIADPRHPRPIGFVKIPKGAHNTSLHPSGKWLYVSDSELTPVTDGADPLAHTGRIEVVDVRDARHMKHVLTLGLPTGLSSHDISFNKKGTRAYSAALTETLILDTSNPAKPSILTTILDPAINISHGADITPDQTHLYITDEQAGAAANGVCNVGGVSVYDISNELAPVKTGFYAFNPANSLTATTNSDVLTCTAHVLDYGPTGTTFSNAGYAAGVRIVDTVGRIGLPKELASFTPIDADTWSAKQYKDKRYLYANDLARGFDVYRWTPGLGPVDTRTANERRYDVRRVGLTTFMAGAWCAQPQGSHAH